MGTRIKWNILCLLVAVLRINCQQLGEQGGSVGSEAIFPRPPTPPPLATYFLEEEVLEVIINENPDADDYPDPLEDSDFKDSIRLVPILSISK